MYDYSLEILDDDEQRRLVALAQAGDREATSKLVEHNARLVYKLAAQNAYRSGAFELQDLIQQGNLGILTAIEKFDPSRSNRFITYANYWIYEKINRYCYQRQHSVSIPYHKSRALSKANYLRSINDDNGRETKIKEIAVMVGISQEELAFLLKASYPVDIDAKNDNGDDWHEAIGSDGLEADVSDKATAQEIVRIIKENLPDISAMILDYFGLHDNSTPLTTGEIAEKYGLTIGTVKNRLRKGIRYLKRRCRA